MKVKSYPESKLNAASNVLGTFFDYAIHDLNMNANIISAYFANSNIGQEFADGNSKWIEAFFYIKC